ncbi:hypothetical protein HOLleu_30301 [Holothuria leucospilota]|uniref:Uncharacterized protein n=1 Tax=Holothuria leucospilota TaxID=206669 RepID=A0A9Q1BK58_HOLLE|nr:hypothetical protein HOLleu_30301 [Holothuria leucospilota]
MLKQLMKKFRLIECTVVEPSGERISSYKKLVEEQKDALHCVTFEWRQETIQEFCNVNADGLKKFNFVSAIHTCYHIAKQHLDFYLNTIFGWTKGTILIMILEGNYHNFLMYWYRRDGTCKNKWARIFLFTLTVPRGGGGSDFFRRGTGIKFLIKVVDSGLW